MKRLILTLAILLTLCVNVFADNEIKIFYGSATDQIVYAVVIDNTNTRVWDVGAADWDATPTAGEIDNYNIVLTFNDLNWYSVDFPAGITVAATYFIAIYDQASGSADTPVVADDTLIGGGDFPWAGVLEVTDVVLLTNISAVLVDTNELQGDWTNGGRLDLILDAVLADTNELQGDWANGGRLDLILDAILTDTNAILIDTGTTLPAAITLNDAFNRRL